MKYIKKVTIQHLILLSCGGLLLLLLYKSPFSDRNLISNLEPYPDTIHYITPAISFIKGEGFFMKREGRIKYPSVPFLYSAVLMPGFLMNSDARMFYFTNVLMAFLSLYLLFKIVDKLFQNPYITGFVLFLYVTNYFIYWYPTLAMADNLIIPLFLLAVLLLLEKNTPKRVLMTGLLAVGFYATKYAAVPLAAAMLLLCELKILLSDEKQKIRFSAILLVSFLAAFVLFFGFEYLTKRTNIFESISTLFMPLFSEVTKISSGIPAVSSNSWFSLDYFPKNFKDYLGAITGHRMRFLWDSTPLVPKYIAVFGLFGLFFGLFTRKFRFIAICLLVFLFSQIVFMSAFYSTDGRYIYHAIPVILIGFGLFLTIIKDFLFIQKAKNLKIVFYLFLAVFFTGYLTTCFSRLKYQVSLNIRHTETPWYYVSIEEANKYFDSSPENNNKKPILISALPPYYVDYFSGNRYLLLPLSYNQEFPKEKEIVWGPQDYSDLIKLYSKYLNKGYEVYVSNYGLGNEAYLHADFDKINSNFTLVKVHEGCFNACNVFKLTPKI